MTTCETAQATGRRGLVLATVCLAVFAMTLDVTIVNVALPDLGRELNASTKTCSGLSTGTTLPSPRWCWPPGRWVTGSVADPRC